MLTAFGFRLAPRRQRIPPGGAAQRIELALERAYQCGARYSRRRWRRRAPPRMRALRISEPGYEHLLDQQRAFYRGYDAFTRARIAHDRHWAEPWLDQPETARAA